MRTFRVLMRRTFRAYGFGVLLLLAYDKPWDLVSGKTKPWDLDSLESKRLNIASDIYFHCYVKVQDLLSIESESNLHNF